MSIDVYESSMSLREITFNRAKVMTAIGDRAQAPIKDIILVFGGWGSSDAGQRLEPGIGPVTGTTKLLDRVRALKSPAGHAITIEAFEGALSEDNPGERAAFELIARNFHPLGKLIVYGYSAGGFSALRLCYRFGMVFQYYNIDERVIVAYPPTGSGKGASPLCGFVRIDKLITIDPATGPISSWSSRRIWPSVRSNLNIYQLNPAPKVRSHGGPTEAFDKSCTKVTNIDWTWKYAVKPEAGHGKIDDDSIDETIDAMTQELYS